MQNYFHNKQESVSLDRGDCSSPSALPLPGLDLIQLRKPTEPYMETDLADKIDHPRKLVYNAQLLILK